MDSPPKIALMMGSTKAVEVIAWACIGHVGMTIQRVMVAVGRGIFVLMDSSQAF